MKKPELLSGPIGGSPLAASAIAGRAPSAWYPPRPATVDDWRERGDLLRREFGGVDWLRDLAPAFAATGVAADRLARVARGGVVVTTGQQPGLFGGPIYTWSKALSALAFADALERETAVPTAPVFWAATDDTDFAEASWTAVAVPGGAELVRLETAVPEGVPMSDVALGDTSNQLALLARGAGSTAYAEAFERLRLAYAPGATVGSAYVALLRALLEPLGVAVLDASHEAVRRAAFPILRRALDRASGVDASIRERTTEINTSGYDARVTPVPGLSLVFARRDGVKRRVRLSDAAAVSTRAVPGILSPNVLLRPVVERALVPTVAYVGGPGEIAYFAQVSAVARALDVTAPLIVPRWSVTILEAPIAELLRAYELAPDDLRDPHAVETRLAKERLPEVIARSLSALREAIDRHTGELAAERGPSAPLLPAEVVEGARRLLRHRVDRLERRYVAAVKRRELQAIRDVGTLRGALFPFGKPQERTLNFVPFLARHGAELLKQMREAAGEHGSALVGAASAAQPRAPARL